MIKIFLTKALEAADITAVITAVLTATAFAATEPADTVFTGG